MLWSWSIPIGRPKFINVRTAPVTNLRIVFRCDMTWTVVAAHQIAESRHTSDGSLHHFVEKAHFVVANATAKIELQRADAVFVAANAGAFERAHSILTIVWQPSLAAAFATHVLVRVWVSGREFNGVNLSIAPT
jgi:hypothetical protein